MSFQVTELKLFLGFATERGLLELGLLKHFGLFVFGFLAG
jgi:hypothetical protein